MLAEADHELHPLVDPDDHTDLCGVVGGVDLLPVPPVVLGQPAHLLPFGEGVDGDHHPLRFELRHAFFPVRHDRRGRHLRGRLEVDLGGGVAGVAVAVGGRLAVGGQVLGGEGRRDDRLAEGEGLLGVCRATHCFLQEVGCF